MANATIGELKAAAVSAGLPPDDRVNIAAAVAMAESGGNLTIRNNTPATGDDSYGAWQINRLAHPQYTPEELRTLSGNARAMAAVSNNGTDWRPWSVYKNGRYLQFLEQARSTPAAGTTTPAGVTTTGTAPVSSPSWVASMFGLDDVGERVIVAGITLILATGGVLLIGLGLLRLTGTDPSKAVALAGTAAAL